MTIAPPVIKRNKPLIQAEVEKPAIGKPLSYVKIKGRANNKIEFMRRSSTPTRRQEGDRLPEVQAELQGRLLKAIEHVNALIVATEAGHEIFTPHRPDISAYLSEEEYERALLDWRRTYILDCPVGLPGKDKYREYRRDPDTKLRQPTNCLVNWRVDERGFYELYDLEGLREAAKTLQKRLLGDNKEEATAILDLLKKLQDIGGVATPKGPPRKLGDDNPTRPFSQNGRDTLLEAGSVIDRICGLNAVEVTLTLPGSSDAAVRALAAWSGWLMNHLLQTIRDWAGSHVKGIVDEEGKELVYKQWLHLVNRSFKVSGSQPFLVEDKPKRQKRLSPSAPKEQQPNLYYFYAWEHQHRGALHAHICIAAPPDEVPIEWLEILGHLLKDQWYKLLERMATTEVVTRYGKKSGPLPGIDMFERNPACVHRGEPTTWRDRPDVWQSHVQKIRKSVAGYFSKYAGKGAAAAKLKKGEEGAFCPSRWWGCCSLTKKAIKEWRFEYTIPYSWQDDGELETLLGEVLNQYRPVIDQTVEWSVKTTYTETVREYDLSDDEIPQLVQTGERSRQREKVLVCGTSRYLYFSPEEFPEVSSLFKALKPNFEELGITSYQRRIDGAVKVDGINPDTNEIIDGYQHAVRQHWLAMQDPELRAIRQRAEENAWRHDVGMWTVLLNNFEPKPEVRRPAFEDIPMDRLAEIFDDLAEIERS